VRPSLALPPVSDRAIGVLMANPDLTDCLISQGLALVRAIEALGTIEPSGPFERALARLLMAAYKRRLRAIAAAVPA
jgi:hypothetical protein